MKTNQATSSILFVIATPIGNLADLSPRAIETLSTCDLILAEDTRSFGRLAQRFSIQTKSISLHEHNEQAKVESLIEQLKNGSAMALVSEAGTPTISDPGYRIVAKCKEHNIPVSPIPGPCAAITALSVSGFETDCFSFWGFPPQKPGKRKKFLESVLADNKTAILYISPHKILKTLLELTDLDPERELFLAREMTKIHEEFLRGTAKELSDEFESRSSIKGEIVLLVKRA